MTFRATHLTIGTAAVAVATATAKNTHEITIEPDANKSIWLGNETVSTAIGFEIAKNTVTVLKIANGDVLYAVSNVADAIMDIYDFQVDP